MFALQSEFEGMDPDLAVFLTSGEVCVNARIATPC